MTTRRTRTTNSRLRRADAARAARDWAVHLSLESRIGTISSTTIRRLTKEILAHVDHEIAPPHVCELHVMVVDDAAMREINRDYRKKDKPTDVLSFPQFTPSEVRGRKKTSHLSGSYLGDLVISSDTTRAQAKRFGVSVQQELIRLLVHGVLHLCGYDHEKVPAREAQRMRRRERVIRLAITRQ